MSELKISQLPVVDDGEFKGIIKEEEILDAADLMLSVQHIMHAGWEGAYVLEDSFIYDIIGTMTTFKLEVLPVLNEEKRFVGVITIRDVMEQLGKLFAIHEPGGVLVLEIPRNSFVLSEIGRIVESENAQVLSLYLSPAPSQQAYFVTLKLNLEDMSRVVASFERFKYKVVKTFFKVEPLQNYQRNLDALMNYLDM